MVDPVHFDGAGKSGSCQSVVCTADCVGMGKSGNCVVVGKSGSCVAAGKAGSCVVAGRSGSFHISVCGGSFVATGATTSAETAEAARGAKDTGQAVDGECHGCENDS